MEVVGRCMHMSAPLCVHVSVQVQFLERLRGRAAMLANLGQHRTFVKEKPLEPVVWPRRTLAACTSVK